MTNIYRTSILYRIWTFFEFNLFSSCPHLYALIARTTQFNNIFLRFVCYLKSRTVFITELHLHGRRYETVTDASV